MAKNIKESLVDIYDVARQSVVYAFGLTDTKPPDHTKLLGRFLADNSKQMTPGDMTIYYFLMELFALISKYERNYTLYKNVSIDDLERLAHGNHDE